MRAIKITDTREDQPGELTVVEAPDTDRVDWLQAQVGGNFDAVNVDLPDGGRVTLWINDEGKYRGDFGPNDLASALCWAAEAIEPSDFIVGPVIILGFDPETGEDLAVPERLELILKAVAGRDTRWRVSFHPDTAELPHDGESEQEAL